MNNVIYTKASIYRNLKDYKFVPKLEVQKKEEIVNLLKTAFKTKLTLTNLQEADVELIKTLKENSLLKPNVNNVFLDKKKSVCVNLFDGEHITIVSCADGYNKSAYNSVKQISDLLSEKISLAYSDDYGFLMSDLNKIGAGIRLECGICLNALKTINKIEQVKQNVRKLGYVINETNIPGIYSLCTLCNLGFSEKDIFNEFEKMVMKLEDLEIESVKMLDVTNHDELVDKANRSLAILNSAHLINYDELDKLLINVRTGINLNILDIDSDIVLNLQKLTKNKNTQIMSKSEHLELALKVKQILKGEKDV